MIDTPHHLLDEPFVPEVGSEVQPEAEVERTGSNPMYKVFDAAFEAAGGDLQWFADHPEESRTLADSITYAKLGVAAGGLALYHYGVHTENTQRAVLGSTITSASFLLDSLDGWVAHRGGVAGDSSGKKLDSTLDVLQRYLVIGSVLYSNREGYMPERAKEAAIRVAAELLVLSTTGPDVAEDEYEPTMVGKVKVWVDGLTFSAELIRSLLGDDHELAEVALRKLTDRGWQVGIGAAVVDGVYRWAQKLRPDTDIKKLAS